MGKCHSKSNKRCENMGCPHKPKKSGLCEQHESQIKRRYIQNTNVENNPMLWMTGFYF